MKELFLGRKLSLQNSGWKWTLPVREAYPISVLKSLKQLKCSKNYLAHLHVYTSQLNHKDSMSHGPVTVLCTGQDFKYFSVFDNGNVKTAQAMPLTLENVISTSTTKHDEVTCTELTLLL